MSKDLVKLTTREFLKLSSFGFAALMLMPGRTIAGPQQYDISYIWHPDLEATLDYMEEVGNVLGPNVRKDLRIVQGDKISPKTGKQNYGIIYNRNGDQASSIKVAQSHARTLRSHDLEGAIEIPDRGYHFLYNVSYGKGPNLGELKRMYKEVATHLGPGVAKKLVIEETDDGQFALVYRRYGYIESTKGVAESHKKKLRKKGIAATHRLANNNDIVFGSSSIFHEEVEQQIKAREEKKKKPKPRKIIPVNFNLEQKVNSYTKTQRRRGRVASNERTAWIVYDFNSGEKIVSINEDVPMQAASMIKPLVALAFFHEVNRGRLTYGPRSRANMAAMIQRSSNTATNWVMKQVGGPRAVQRILKNNYGGMLAQTSIKEYIPSGGRTYRNLASAHDYSRFLFALWNNKLPYSKEIRKLMNLPNRDRIFTGASHIPYGTAVYHKTGTTARCCGDMGILVAKNGGTRVPYIMIGIIDKSKRTTSYKSWSTSRGNVIREVSNIVYDYMAERYGLRR